MSTIRFAYKLATFGTYVWLGWKLASLDTRINDTDDIWAAEVDALDQLTERVRLLENSQLDAELALAWEGR